MKHGIDSFVFIRHNCLLPWTSDLSQEACLWCQHSGCITQPTFSLRFSWICFCSPCFAVVEWISCTPIGDAVFPPF